MTIFKNSKDGKLYIIQVIDKDGVKKYNAIPANSGGYGIINCDISNFSIHSMKNGPKSSDFL